MDSSSWSIFFDDLNDLDRGLIAGAFPGRDVDAAWEQLATDKAFLDFVWSNHLRSATFASLFEAYESTTRKGRDVLDRLQHLLRDSFGLRVETEGAYPGDAEHALPEADVVFLDLFLEHRMV